MLFIAHHSPFIVSLPADYFSILLEQAGGFLILQLRAKVDQLLFEC